MSSGASGQRVALRNVRVFDGHCLTEPRIVVIDGAVIGEYVDRVPAGVRPLDAAGATLLPGLIDAHVHLHSPENLDQLARWGVTTGLDMACWPLTRVAALRTGAETGTAARADFRTAGLPAIGPGGAHAHMPGMPGEAIVMTEEQARAHVAARVNDGVDYVKIVADAPGDGPSPAVMAAVVAAARAHGLDTVVHAATTDAYAAAVACGARFVTHVPVVGRIRTEDVAAMAAQGRVAVPTAVMMAGIIASGRLGDRGNLADPLASITALHRAGVPVLAGTDANAAPGAPGAVEHGQSLHEELELLVASGMSTAEVLRAATDGPARAFGLTDRGAVRPGLRADLVLIEGDPIADIRATRAVRAVWCAGVSVTDAVVNPLHHVLEAHQAPACVDGTSR